MCGAEPYVCLCLVQVKAWCYYESRLLGAHHGLISTYALETLVLYVFNKYHNAIDSPLSVRLLAAWGTATAASRAAGGCVQHSNSTCLGRGARCWWSQ